MAPAGTEFLPHFRRQAWTLTPLQVWGYIGPAADEVERLLLADFVITCDSEPVTRVTTVSFADLGGCHHKASACFEAALHASLNQGQVFKNLSLSVEILSTDAPVVSNVTKPIPSQGKNAFSVLSSLADAAGWWLRFDDGTGALEGEGSRLKRAP